MTQFGFGGLSSRTVSGVNNKIPQNNNNRYSIKIGRVSDIILDSNHPLFNKPGTLGEEGWSSLGNISFTDMTIDGPTDGVTNIAKSINPSIKQYPAKNELVYILTIPDIGDKFPTNYYIGIINRWNTTAHNADPFYLNVKPKTKSNKSYDSVLTSGNPGKTASTPSTVDLISNYLDSIYSYPLYGYIGDYIIEGRFNNSLRLGQTYSSQNNNWSSGKSINGDPISILRNHKFVSSRPQEADPYVTEDINRDNSSIYLTSTQKIPLNTKGENYRSYSSPPTTIAQFEKPQIILASNRLVLCSKEDHILINSAKSIGLSSVESINLASNKEIILDSGKISLGNLNATEPVLLGGKTVDLLGNLLSSLSSLCDALEGSKDWPQGLPETADIIVNAASNTKGIVDQLSRSLDSLKSKVTKTI